MAVQRRPLTALAVSITVLIQVAGFLSPAASAREMSTSRALLTSSHLSSDGSSVLHSSQSEKLSTGHGAASDTPNVTETISVRVTNIPFPLTPVPTFIFTVRAYVPQEAYDLQSSISSAVSNRVAESLTELSQILSNLSPATKLSNIISELQNETESVFNHGPAAEITQFFCNLSPSTVVSQVFPVLRVPNLDFWNLLPYPPNPCDANNTRWTFP